MVEVKWGNDRCPDCVGVLQYGSCDGFDSAVSPDEPDKSSYYDDVRSWPSKNRKIYSYELE